MNLVKKHFLNNITGACLGIVIILMLSIPILLLGHKFFAEIKPSNITQIDYNDKISR